MLIQLEDGRQDEAVENLKVHGIEVLEWVPVSAVSARVPAGVDPLAIAGVRWAGSMQPFDKLSAKLEQYAAATQFAVCDLFPGSDASLVATLMEALLEPGVEVKVIRKLSETSLLLEANEEGLRAVSALSEVSYLFPASKSLIDGEITSRCGGAMTAVGPAAPYVLNGPGWDGSGLGAASLTYRFDASVSGTGGISATSLRNAIRSGITRWSNFANITFTETTVSKFNRSIEVYWGAAPGEPFDGRSGTLAYCFYPSPPNGETVAGDMHFDPAENWSIGSFGTDVFSVALYEAGHGLGLNHSDDPNAVMCPFYQYSTDLQPDDVAGVRALYSSQGGGGGDSYESDNTFATAKPLPPAFLANPQHQPHRRHRFCFHLFAIRSRSDHRDNRREWRYPPLALQLSRHPDRFRRRLRNRLFFAHCAAEPFCRTLFCES